MHSQLANLPELKALDDAFCAVQADTLALIANLDETQAAWRPHPAAWSIA
jgi:hypothetical protein